MTETFQRLHRGFGQPDKHTPVPCTKDDVAAKLGYTSRNAVIVLKRLQEQGWLTWEPGHGRGHKSVLTFLQDENGITVEAAKQKIDEGALSEGFRLIRHSVLDLGAKRAFMEWMFSRLGYFEEHLVEEQTLDVLRIAFYRALASLDPITVTRRTEAHIVHQAFDTLLQMHPHTQELQPCLAHHIEPDETYTNWKIFLRKGVRFHSGAEMTADDAAYTLTRLATVDSAHRRLFRCIQSVEAVSNYELHVTLDGPNTLFPNLLALTPSAIVPKPTHPGLEMSPRTPVGTGAFRIVQNDENKLVLEAFDKYYFGRPMLDRIEIWVVPEQVWNETLQENQMHYVSGRLETARGFRMEAGNFENGGRYVTFNLAKQGPQQSLAFRKLIGELLAPAAVIQATNQPELRPATSFLPSVSENHKRWVMPHRLPTECQRRELREARYHGEALTLLTYQMPSNIADVEKIKEILGQAGIRVTVKVIPASELGAAVFQDADMVYVGEVFDKDVILSYLGVLYADHSPIHTHMPPDLRAQADVLHQKLMQTPMNYETKLSMLLEFEQVLRDAYFILFLSHEQQRAAVTETVQGLVMDSLGWLDYRKLWFRRGNRF